jgi:microcompartment protein CcmK/EutM
LEVCKVVGQAVATAKDEGLRATKLMIVRATDHEGKVVGEPFAATDTVGAGENELVLVARGSAARATRRTHDVPTDAAIVAILDSLSLEGKVTYRKA